MRVSRFGVYLNTEGNYFHGEIRNLIVAGLSKHHTVTLCDENDSFSSELDWHVIIAPHEFFFLGNGKSLQNRTGQHKLIFITTEQIGSSWFERASRLFSKAISIWDIDLGTSRSISDQGFPCYHIEVGYHQDSDLFKPIIRLPVQNQYFFGRNVQNSPSFLNEPYHKRPIDVFFVGAWTPRRSQIFAELGPALAKWNSIILLVDTSRPVKPQINSSLSTRLICGLEQRSKIILNIHRDDRMYFESHRIVLHGVAQKALVLSEPCTPNPQYGPSDFITVKSDQLINKLEYYLSDEEGRVEASSIVDKSSQKFLSECMFQDNLNKLTESLPQSANA